VPIALVSPGTEPPLAPVRTEVPGWFGKLPMLGDFASRRLPPAAVSVCDAWLSGGLSASQAQLGVDWLEAYLSAPLWSFAWAPGVADTSWWFGVCMPSVDAAGRYFPLLAAATTHDPSCLHAPAAAMGDWYARLSLAVLGVLQPKATVEAFESVLELLHLPTTMANLNQPHCDVPAQAIRPMRMDVDAADWPGCGVPLSSALAIVPPHSAWWVSRPDGQTRLTVTLCQGLPGEGRFADLLQGYL
jgi:type VI secretion system protein ImpM